LLAQNISYVFSIVVCVTEMMANVARDNASRRRGEENAKIGALRVKQKNRWLNKNRDE
jgi:hypothetical protein